MAGVGRALRAYWLHVLISLAAPVVAVYFLLPSEPLPFGMFDRPYGSYVEVTVDRLQPLPWTVRHPDGQSVLRRYVLGWIGHRALLLETPPEPLTERTLRGTARPLAGEPRAWVDETPQLAPICYNAILEVGRPRRTPLLLPIALIITAVMIGFWGKQLFRWRKNGEPVNVAEALEVPPPRSDELVSAVMRRQGILEFAGGSLLYALTVMMAAGIFTAVKLGLDFMDDDSFALQLGRVGVGFVVASPISILPLVWWIRRRRRELWTVVRFGETVDAYIVSGTVTGSRSVLGHVKMPTETHLQIDVLLGATRLPYGLRVRRKPDWVESGRLRAIATREHRYAVILCPDGEVYVVSRRITKRWRSSGDGGGVPKARVIQA